jgi:hypothetical protein
MSKHTNFFKNKGRILVLLLLLVATFFVNNNFVTNANSKKLSVLNNFTYGVAVNDPSLPPSTKLIEGPWVLSDWNDGNTNWLSEFNKPQNLDKTPLIYMYVVAGRARADWGLQDCNVGESPDKTLCKNGANYLRQNSQKIQESYINSVNKSKTSLVHSEKSHCI